MASTLVQCTARVTGQHTSASAAARCPACRPRRTLARSLPAVAPPTFPAIAGHELDANVLRHQRSPAEPVADAVLSRMPLNNLIMFARDDVRLADPDTIARAFALLRDSGATLPSGISVACLLSENKYAPPSVVREAWQGSRGALGQVRHSGEVLAVLLAAARHRNAPSDVLVAAAGHKNVSIRVAAASNKRWPPDALAMVADEWVRGEEALDVLQALATNPSLPLDALKRLAAHWASTVRRKAARSRRLSPGTLGKLASDDSKMVRRDVARNPNTPVAALQRLGVDEYPPVRGEAYDTMRVKLVREYRIERDNTEALDFLLGDLTPEVHSQHQDDLLANPPAWTRRTFSENEIELALLVHPNTGRKEARR